MKYGDIVQKARSTLKQTVERQLQDTDNYFLLPPRTDIVTATWYAEGARKDQAEEWRNIARINGVADPYQYTNEPDSIDRAKLGQTLKTNQKVRLVGDPLPFYDRTKSRAVLGVIGYITGVDHYEILTNNEPELTPVNLVGEGSEYYELLSKTGEFTEQVETLTVGEYTFSIITIDLDSGS